MFRFLLLLVLCYCVCIVHASEMRTDDSVVRYINTTQFHSNHHVFHSLIRNRIWDTSSSNSHIVTIQHHTHHEPTTATPTASPTTGSPITTQPPTTSTPTTPIPATTVPPTSTATPTTQQPTLAPPANGISPSVTYHNGVLVKNIPIVYLIYYGNWNTLDPLAIPLITDYLTHLSGSTVMNIATTYYDNTPPGTGTRYLTNQLIYGGYILNTSYPFGTTLSDTDLFNLISDATTKLHTLPVANSSNIYFVLTAPDTNVVSAPGDAFCVTYCGYHTAAYFPGSIIGYWGFIGSSIRCGGCTAPGGLGSPNNASNADSMISILHHELFETISDPLVSGGWYDSNHDEIGDRCQWNYQLVYKTSNGAYANVYIGSRNYLIQSMLVNQHGGYCANILY